MRQNARQIKFLTIITVAILTFSMVFMSNNAIVPLTNEPSSELWDLTADFSPYESAVDPEFDNGTFVDWYQETDSASDEWTTSQMNWLFGPSPSFKVYHENETYLDETHYALIDEQLSFNVVIPKSILPPGTDLGMVMFYGQAVGDVDEGMPLFLMAYAPGESNLSIILNFPFPNWVDAESPWYGIGDTFDIDKVEETGSYIGAQNGVNFMDLDTGACEDGFDDFNYYYNFSASFNNDTPRALYRIGMMVFDTSWNQIASYNYNSQSAMQGICIGVPPSEAWVFSYGGTYTLQKLDLLGNEVFSVSREEDFLMRFNITGGDPDIVELILNVPSSIYSMVNRTGWHWEIVTETGGWVYNDTLGTYVWDALVEVTYEAWLYGEYQEQDYTETGTWIEFYDYALMYNYTHEYYYVEYVPMHADRQFKFIYNATTDSFETQFGYEYYAYPLDHYVEGIWEEMIIVREPIPVDQVILYELNTTHSSAITIGGELIVDFRGHFTENMPVTDEYSWYEWWVNVESSTDWFSAAAYMGTGQQTTSDYEMARRIVIESPVTIAKLLLENGEEPAGWLFQAEPGENFQVWGRLQGGAGIADEIDAVQFTLNAWDGRWTETEDIRSLVTYEVTVDMDGTPHLRAFNFTEKYNWTYGSFYDYVWTTVTGWHNVYDEVTNTWNTVYGDYEEWQWMEVEDWHWEMWYYNQITSEWQLQWFNERSAETEITPDFCIISDFNSWIDGGDLYASFLVNLTESIPETDYYWEFAFTANQWFMDYASDYGEHYMEAWDNEWIYSFEDPDNPGTDIFVNPFTYNQLAFFNDTLCALEGVEYFKGDERPYIVIDGDSLPINVRETYDPYSGETYTDMFFYDYWDYETDKYFYYYELVNETKISVTYTESVYIYNITLINGMSFLSAQRYAYGWSEGVDYYSYWFDLDGALYMGDPSLYDSASVVFYGQVEPETRDNYYVVYGLGNTLELAMDWRWDSMTQSYFMTDSLSNFYQVIWNSVTYQYEFYIDGSWEHVSYPIHYMTAEFELSQVLLFTWETQRFWFHENGGVQYEMPYPGANAEYWHHLGETDSQGGMVPSVKSIVYQGDAYPVGGEGPYWVYIDSTNYTLDMYNYYYSAANDTDIWNPDTPYYTAVVGTFGDDLGFTLAENVEFTYADYDFDGDYHYFTLNNGTVWMVNESMHLLLIYQYELDGETFYSTHDWPQYFESGTEWFYYYESLNGTWFNMTGWELLEVQATFKVEVFDNGTMYYNFMAKEYEYQWGDGYLQYVHKVLNATTWSGDQLYIPYNSEEYGFHEVFQFDYHGTLVNATASLGNIHRLRTIWGYDFVYGPQPLESVVYKNFNNLVIGNPTWGMWGVESWTVNPDNGALDLDGDLETENDQYYILEVYTSTEYWNHTWNMMWVDVVWDPNTTLYGDDMNADSWMGLNTFTWGYEWNRDYYWFHADPLDALTSAEFDAVEAIVLTPEGDSRPGYWDIGWMAKNTTYADYILEAEANGWDWVESNEQTWTWISFGMNEEYGIDYRDPPFIHYAKINMHYEFSGLLIWEDTNQNDEMDVDIYSPGTGELTHYFLPNSVESVTFVYPGAAYGDPSASGEMRVELDDEVTWGVTFTGINGTAYPYNEYGYWGWYERVIYGSDMRTFDERPIDVSIDEVSFLVHFEGNLNATTGAINNNVNIKVDNYIGNWDVDMLGGRKNLENRSLALNYLAEVNVEDFAFKVQGKTASAHETLSAEEFQFETANTRFAELIMGGTTYDWGKNTSAPYDVISHTTPVSTFSTAYESKNGKNAMGWNFTDSMFYVTIGFPEWDGYSVFQDPVFVGYTSTTGTNPITFGTLAIESGTPLAGESVTIGIDVTSQVAIDSVDLLYSTDQVTWSSVSMASADDVHWTGDIPSHANETQVYYKVVVHTVDNGDYESAVSTYIVGSDEVPPTPTDPVTTTVTSPSLPVIDEQMLMILGIAGVVGIIAVLVVVKRRT